jgi:excisionase family DNA binding protein
MTVAERDLLTPEQVADYLQVRTRTVAGWLRKGSLPGIRLGRLWRVRRQELEGFLRLREATAGVRPEDPRLREYTGVELDSMLTDDATR